MKKKQTTRIKKYCPLMPTQNTRVNRTSNKSKTNLGALEGSVVLASMVTPAELLLLEDIYELLYIPK